MAVLTGNYASIGVGSVANQQDFVLVRRVDTTDFRTGADILDVRTIVDQSAQVITYGLNGDKAKNAKELMVSLGLDKQYDVHGRTPKYKCIMGVSDKSQKLGDPDIKMLEIVKGMQPDYWEDEVNAGHIYTATVDPQSNDLFDDEGEWRIFTRPDSWDPTTQYYVCNENGGMYYIGDESASGKYVAMYLGRGLLDATNSLRISEYVLKSPAIGSGGIPNWGWWQYWYPQGSQYICSYLQPTGGYTNMNQSTVNTTADISYFTAQLDGYRNLNSATTYYRSDWKISGDAIDEWKNLCKSTVELQNLTITQFGTLTHDDHTYFGVWVVEPELKNYIGYNIVPSQDNPIYNGDYRNTSDLRIRGEFTDPASRTDYDFSRIRFYGIELSELDITVPISDGPAPPPTNPLVPGGKDWPKLDPVYLSGRQTGLLAGADQTGFHIYYGDETSLNEFQSLIWKWGSLWGNGKSELMTDGKLNPLRILTSTFWLAKGGYEAAMQSTVDPLAAIQFIHCLPQFAMANVGTWTTIKIAGVDTGVRAFNVKKDVIPFSVTIDCSGLPSTQSYLDLSPYSTAEIYIPYIGTIQLNPDDFIGGEIVIKFNCCLQTGAISAHLLCYNSLANGYVTEYGPYIGDAKHAIPVAQKDKNAFDREMGVIKAIGTSVAGLGATVVNSFRTVANANSQRDIANGGMQNIGIMGGASALGVKRLADSFLMKQQFHGSELGSNSAIVCPTSDIYVMYSTPAPVHSDFTDVKRKGLTSGKVKSVSLCKEAGKTTFVKFNYIDLSGVSATEAELQAIHTFMLGGVYI